MLKVTVAIGSNIVDVEGDVSFTDAMQVVDKWFNAISLDVAKARAEIARLDESTAALRTAVAANNP